MHVRTYKTHLHTHGHGNQKFGNASLATCAWRTRFPQWAGRKSNLLLARWCTSSRSGDVQSAHSVFQRGLVIRAGKNCCTVYYGVAAACLLSRRSVVLGLGKLQDICRKRQFLLKVWLNCSSCETWQICCGRVVLWKCKVTGDLWVTLIFRHYNNSDSKLILQ